LLGPFFEAYPVSRPAEDIAETGWRRKRTNVLFTFRLSSVLATVISSMANTASKSPGGIRACTVSILNDYLPDAGMFFNSFATVTFKALTPDFSIGNRSTCFEGLLLCANTTVPESLSV
jgi:hypothetical protein